MICWRTPSTSYLSPHRSRAPRTTPAPLTRPTRDIRYSLQETEAEETIAKLTEENEALRRELGLPPGEAGETARQGTIDTAETGIYNETQGVEYLPAGAGNKGRQGDASFVLTGDALSIRDKRTNPLPPHCSSSLPSASFFARRLTKTAHITRAKGNAIS